jgi:hypothetical protein
MGAGPNVAAGEGGGMALVKPPTTIAVAEGAREIGELEMVMAGPPGMRVWEPTM